MAESPCSNDGERLLRSGSDKLHDSLVRSSTTSIFDKYEIVKQLGDGAMGTVSVVRIRDGKVGGTAFEHQAKGVLGLLGKKKITIPTKDRPKESSDYMFAMKTIKLERMNSRYIDDLVNEISILKTLDHPNIIKAYEVYYNKRLSNKDNDINQLIVRDRPADQIYIVMELCTGGDLFKRAPYSQQDAAKIIVQILNAIRYMHSNNVVHRDLKFENILFTDKSPDAQIKIIDFGVSKKFFNGEPDYITGVVGTFYSMAPQVLQGVYSSQADMWSLGVIAYMLLSTSRPFYSANNKKMVHEIMTCNPSYDGPGWELIDDSAKNFVQRLLVIDPNHRMTAAMAIEHEWIQNIEKLPNARPNDTILERIDECLVLYKHTSELKKIALNIVAHKSTNAQILELRKIFERFDVNHNGILSFDDFKKVLQKNKDIDDNDIKEIFESVDINQNGRIMYNEFLAATLEAQGRIEEDRIAEAFDRLDCDRSGYITKDDLKSILGSHVTTDEVEKIITDAGYDKDGRISYKEFLRFFKDNRYQCRKKFAANITSAPTSRTGSVDSSNHVATGQGLEDMTNLVGLDAKIPGGSFDEKLMKKNHPMTRE